MGSLFYFLVLWFIPLSGPSLHTESMQPIAVPPDTAATMVFAGDLNLSYRFEQYVGTQTDYAFSRLKSIGAFDVMMANLENPVTSSTDSVDKDFVFRMQPRYLPIIKRAGISVVNCANNHTGDFGREGIIETVRDLDTAGILHTGAGNTLAEARKPVILRIHGKTIGILGYGGNGIHYAGEHCAGTVPGEKAIMVGDIRSLRKNVDLVVVNIHWGEECAEMPNDRQIQLGHALIDAGADLIIGHHPHVPQGIERYKNGVIAYSLGNFVFGGNGHDINSETFVMKVEVTAGGWHYEPVPVVVNRWQPGQADSAAAHRILSLVAARSTMLNTHLASQSRSSL